MSNAALSGGVCICARYTFVLLPMLVISGKARQRA